ncbi:uncharacterized protein HMPREF1541_05237 [Cyphellophora europaea CBS 101466]|uniref:Acyltransferase 3 domain-containing protein n=1 Tax=Cyphellophora europaea (strain CBS 101466) TaxID=1220924 RepID=W2RX10_CYPE1|nr:uncharacterized protein HMPREF1541_05237 [Cyphellophora europaea CBS 101466]ETN40957.1 hypothetical protein HMPREF1541_05237 [Cyphellophora europaea CBS 101466]
MYTTRFQMTVPRWLRQQRPQDGEEAVSLIGDDIEKREDDGHRITALPDASVYQLTPRTDNSSFLNRILSIVGAVVNTILHALRPSFFGARTPRKLHPTSYLDGLRGCAAFIVFLHHSTQSFYRVVRPGYGSSAMATHPLSLPILRVLFAGGPMVSIFFVISGYVLSTKPLKLARLGRTAEVYECVASSTFRRGPRLYIPCLTATLLIALAAQAGLTDVQAPRVYLPSPDGLYAQLYRWASASSWFISPFASEHWFEPNTWTIPIEFKGSLLVFLSCMGLAKSSSRFRLGFLLCMAGFWLWHGWWDMFLFSMGMACADLHFVHTPIPLPTDGAAEGMARPPMIRRHGIRTRLLHAFSILLCVYLLGCPEGDEGGSTTPGYITLTTTLTPPGWEGHFGPGRWWPVLSSVLLVLTLDHAGPESIYQRVFVSNFAQWLGDISFALYLCHAAVLYSVSSRAVRWGCAIMSVDYGTGINGQGGPSYFVVLVGATMITVPILVWMSEVLTAVVDKGAVELARRMRAW